MQLCKFLVAFKHLIVFSIVLSVFVSHVQSLHERFLDNEPVISQGFVHDLSIGVGLDHHPHLFSDACEPIKINLCMDLGYNETKMPNLVGHDAQTDAEALLQTFTPLIQYGCSANLKLFLCSSHVPMCTEKVPEPIGPCRSLCESVRNKCEPVLSEFGFKWPPSLDCSKFHPMNNHEHMCIPGPLEPKSPPKLTKTFNFDPFLTSRSNSEEEEVFRAKNIGGVTKSPNLVLLGDGKVSSEQFKCLKDGDRKLWSRGTCWTKCGNYKNSFLDDRSGEVLFSGSEKEFGRNYGFGWAIVALCSALIALTLSFKSNRVNASERPIMYIALCEIMLSIGTIIGTSSDASCFIDKSTGVELLAGQNYLPSPCALIFLLSYFFGMAGNFWWVVLCLNLMLSRNAKLSAKLEQREKSFCHLICWGLPFFLTSTSLITKRVDADELFGICGVGYQDVSSLTYFVFLPLTLSLSASLLFLIVSGASFFPTPLFLGGQKELRPTPCCSHPPHTTCTKPLGAVYYSATHTHFHHHHSCSLASAPPQISASNSPTFFSPHLEQSSRAVAGKLKAKEESRASWRRVAIFATLNFLPILCQVAALGYEIKNRESWEEEKSRPNFQVFLLKITMSLAPGLITGLWVLFLVSKPPRFLTPFSSPSVFKSEISLPSSQPMVPNGNLFDGTSTHTTSPLLVPANSTVTSYVTLNGPGVGRGERGFKKIVPPSLPARNPDQNGWRRGETIV